MRDRYTVEYDRENERWMVMDTKTGCVVMREPKDAKDKMLVRGYAPLLNELNHLARLLEED